MHGTTSRPPLVVTADGRGVASHAGTRLLADVADSAGLAVMLADGGAAISDLAVLRDQAGLFGPVASTAAAWRVLDGIDGDALQRVRIARAAARDRAWLLREEAGRPPRCASRSGVRNGSAASCWRAAGRSGSSRRRRGGSTASSDRRCTRRSRR